MASGVFSFILTYTFGLITSKQMRKKGENTSRTHHRVCFGRSGCTDAKKSSIPATHAAIILITLSVWIYMQKNHKFFLVFLSFSRPNRYIFLHCGRLNELNLIRASHLPVVNNADFPAVKKKKLHPASSEIMSKNQFSRCLLSALLVLTLRSGQLRPSVRPLCPSGCSHLLSTASPGAQDQGKKLTEPRSCPRGLKEGLWLLT